MIVTYLIKRVFNYTLMVNWYSSDNKVLGDADKKIAIMLQCGESGRDTDVPGHIVSTDPHQK